MNKDILIEYLSSMPHSNLVQHCIYLENENANYKAQKYITDFISENGIICEKNKEIERLNNIIDELENFIKTYAIPEFNLSEEPTRYFMETKIILDKLKELKEGKE